MYCSNFNLKLSVSCVRDAKKVWHQTIDKTMAKTAGGVKPKKQTKKTKQKNKTKTIIWKGQWMDGIASNAAMDKNEEKIQHEGEICEVRTKLWTTFFYVT